MTLVLRFAAGSHKGLIREGNEDSGYAGPRLLAVADGMGGAAAGEVASSEVLGSIVRLDEDVPGADLLTLLGDAVQGANDRLRQMVEEDPQLEGMGCTLTAMLWTGQRMGLVHVGDSRAYLLRDGSLVQITQDHTWVQRLVDEGRITPEEAETHPQRSLLMRALDGRGQVEPDLSIREVRAGDRYLICSDGLSGPVSHQTLQDTLGSYYSPEQTVQELIQLALRGGGPDNITCIVADVIDVGATDTMSGQFNDVPVVVGAVADTPPSSTAADHSIADTPAGRAAGLGRGPQGAFGPAEGYQDGYGAAQGGFGPAEGYEGEEGYGYPAEPSVYGTDEFDEEQPPKRKRRGLTVPLAVLITLGLLGGAGYFGYQWTQDQYYIGEDGDHVAIYQGINQNLAGLSLSSVHESRSDAPLKWLPQDQRTQVNRTISVGSLKDAEKTVSDLADWAKLCQKAATAPPQGTQTAQPGQPAQATKTDFVAATPVTPGEREKRNPPAAAPSTSPTASAPATPAPTQTATPPAAGAPSEQAQQPQQAPLSDDERTRAESCPKP
ncbi:protein phosphatase 2C domain-containing protein [Kitasatospora aureofaciens]|uniref:Serine/threonine protein phosphatase PstP n=1 Tax=Kitasatospora aureofaciens TaxID=1894 RepID=A0A1E7NB58_KITAU|nr:protein phosphatase 2C domain-containing protein [Kitasatospora aureofaciens]ARF79433.1 protein phosphatase [Kitasatospora aureofaciens]OEV37884.1 protein phosphatase [Kitasatospora aureofaciens]GGU66286.1 protein phosphatase [Kitasatospora aureofaciens]